VQRHLEMLPRVAAVVATRFLLPADRRRALERRLRGREEARALARADAALVSYGKSGRTWLRLMLSRFYQQRFGLSAGVFLEYDNLHRLNPAVPRVYFTHGNYLRDYTGHRASVVEDFARVPVVLLVRDPRDVAVSQYFQWQGRMHPHKKWLNAYPPHGAELSVAQFVLDHEAGLTRAIEFLCRWADAVPKLERIEVVRYEDMRARPAEALGRVLHFLGAEPQPEELADAVDYASFDNMRRLEEAGEVRASGQRLIPGRRGDTSTYKVRRAVVGGYRDHFDPEQLATLDARVRDELGSAFGYVAAAETAEGRAGA